MDKLDFNLFMKAIECAPCNDAIKHIVDKLDKHFRDNELDCNEKDWPELSSLVQKKKDKGDDNFIKNVWRVAFVGGKYCAMINDEKCTYIEALEFAIHRFDSKRVLTVD